MAKQLKKTPYIKPPRRESLSVKAEFADLVHQYEPEYFRQSDASLIMEYLKAHTKLRILSTELVEIEDYISENDMGTESVHPIVRAYDICFKQMLTLSNALKLNPTSREGKTLNVNNANDERTTGPTNKRLVFKFAQLTSSDD